MMDELFLLRNGERFLIERVPEKSFNAFRQHIIDTVASGAKLTALFVVPDINEGYWFWAGLGHAEHGWLSVVRAKLTGNDYPSMTPECTQAHLFEREIAEQWGIIPEGHPWLKPVRFYSKQSSSKKVSTSENTPGVIDFFQVHGNEIHEVAVGPVHAGVIEPGHFRFQCHGEIVKHLEISLGYQHRGIEQMLIGGPDSRTPLIMETVAGDSTIAYASAYAEVMESLLGIAPPLRAKTIRAIALELERLANHTGDLGALSGDIGYLPTASFCGRLRGELLNLTAAICGNRFGRGLIKVGGVAFDIQTELASSMLKRLNTIFIDLTQSVELLFKSTSAMSRFEETGVLRHSEAIQIGLVGPAARACGIDRDVRVDFPTGVYGFHILPVSSWATGDVFARAFVRWMECQRSVTFIRNLLNTLDSSQQEPVTMASFEAQPLTPNSGVITLVEGWRGAVTHIALTQEQGHFTYYKLIDPSFYNWFGLALAMRGQAISDFPLCNKSFNLSYCGHDL